MGLQHTRWHKRERVKGIRKWIIPSPERLEIQRRSRPKNPLLPRSPQAKRRQIDPWPHQRAPPPPQRNQIGVSESHWSHVRCQASPDKSVFPLFAHLLPPPCPLHPCWNGRKVGCRIGESNTPELGNRKYRDGRRLLLEGEHRICD